ncbi:hypothetical protein ACFLT9_12960 [Acidobacteriota bacterium]
MIDVKSFGEVFGEKIGIIYLIILCLAASLSINSNIADDDRLSVLIEKYESIIFAAFYSLPELRPIFISLP